MTITRKRDLVSETLDHQSQLNNLDVDTIEKIAPKTEVAPPELSARERAKLENALYIEPKRTLKGFGTLPEKLKREHAHAWEYVKGMFENYIVNTEALTFWLSLYPGDPDCLWEIPPNRPVYIPRHVANHLEEVMKYHKFDYVPKAESQWVPGQSIEHFLPVSTHFRGKFRAIGAFA